MARACPGFLSMKHAEGYCYTPLDGMLVHLRVTPQQFVASTRLYTWGTMGEERHCGVKFLV